MIYFNADIRSAHARSDDSITSGSAGIPVVLALDSAFDGLAKTLCFKTATASVDIVLVGDTTESTVPQDVIANAGEWLQIGIYAADGDGNIVIPTAWASAGKIEQGAIPSGIDPSEPTPSWVAQVQSIASEALETANSVREDADNGEFDGEPGEVGANGATFIPNVDPAGNISWTNDGDLPNPEPRNIRGPQGEDGFSPTITAAEITGGHRLTITDNAGTQTVDVMNGAKGDPGQPGQDYVLTAQDKQEIADIVLADLPTWTGGSY